MRRFLVVLMMMVMGGLIMEHPIILGDSRVSGEKLRVRRGERKIEKAPPISQIVPETVNVGGTLAGQVVVGKYYKNLRCVPGGTPTTQVTITADWLSVSDVYGDVIQLQDVNVTCDISLSGPIINGRDGSGTYAQYAWPNFYIIYSPSLQSTKSLSSLSATSPTLPTDYTHWMRVTARWCDLAGSLYGLSSLNRKTWWGANAKIALNDGDVASPGTWYLIDLSNAVPPTAMEVFGNFGQTNATAGDRGMAIASSNTGQCKVSGTINATNAATNFEPSAGVWFQIPLLTAQTVWYTGDNTNLNMTVVIAGWEDEI